MIKYVHTFNESFKISCIVHCVLLAQVFMKAQVVMVNAFSLKVVNQMVWKLVSSQALQ